MANPDTCSVHYLLEKQLEEWFHSLERKLEKCDAGQSMVLDLLSQIRADIAVIQVKLEHQEKKIKALEYSRIDQLQINNDTRKFMYIITGIWLTISFVLPLGLRYLV